MSAMTTGVSGITRDTTLRTIGVGAGHTDWLSSFHADKDLWSEAIDQMLGWKSGSIQFEAADRPDEDILSTAIDYAVDQINAGEGASAPNSIIPSGSGRVAMEWNDGQRTIIIEFFEPGRANYTEIYRGKFARKITLVRNPTSRQLELRG